MLSLHWSFLSVLSKKISNTGYHFISGHRDTDVRRKLFTYGILSASVTRRNSVSGVPEALYKRALRRGLQPGTISMHRKIQEI